MWRSPALEELIGGLLDASGFSEAALERLVTAGARESEQLDFKAKPHLPETAPSKAKSPPTATAPVTAPSGASAPTSGGAAAKGRPAWKPEQEWAKDVCQFANHRGGLLVIGIKEEEDVATEAKATVQDPASLEQRLRLALTNYTAPTPRVDFTAVESTAGSHYLCVVVPPSGLAPHAVTGGPGDSRRTLHFPVRDGADTRYMEETEIADRYRRRSLARAEHSADMEAVVEAAAEQLGLTSDLWLYVAVNPESPASATLDKNTVKQVREWQAAYGYVSPLERGMFFSWNGVPAPGRVTFTGQSAQAGAEPTDPRDGFVELYVDGRSFAAKPVTFDTADDAADGQVGLMTLVDDTAIVVDHALSWTLQQAGNWGAADIQVGLMSGGELDLPYATPLSLHTVSGGTFHRMSNTRLVRRPVKALLTADLGSCSTMQGRMAVVHDAASALLQHFGLAHADMIESDGTVLGWMWSSTHRSKVKSWADNYDVPYREQPI